MDETKKEIRKACKVANKYIAWRNPFGVWFVTLYDKNDESFLDFQYSDDFPKRERDWVLGLLNQINERRKQDGIK